MDKFETKEIIIVIRINERIETGDIRLIEATPRTDPRLFPSKIFIKIKETKLRHKERQECIKLSKKYNFEISLFRYPKTIKREISRFSSFALIRVMIKLKSKLETIEIMLKTKSRILKKLVDSFIDSEISINGFLNSYPAK